MRFLMIAVVLAGCGPGVGGDTVECPFIRSAGDKWCDGARLMLCRDDGNATVTQECSAETCDGSTCICSDLASGVECAPDRQPGAPCGSTPEDFVACSTHSNTEIVQCKDGVFIAIFECSAADKERCVHEDPSVLCRRFP